MAFVVECTKWHRMCLNMLGAWTARHAVVMVFLGGRRDETPSRLLYDYEKCPRYPSTNCLNKILI